MDIVIRPDAAAAAELAASMIAAELRANPRLVLGLATGCTMESVYGELARMHRDERLDFSFCRTFNLDEYVGVPSTDRHSYRHYMNRHLFHKVNIASGNTHVPNGIAEDLEAECAGYERHIAEAGGIDLQLLGIGLSGHLGFNEPLSALQSRTRVTTLAPKTIAQNARLFGGPEKMPRRAITMGVATILNSRQCLLLATGEDKAAILAKAVEGPITSMISASALQLHPQCVVVADEAAAAQLSELEYYRSIFENEPRWEPFRNRHNGGGRRTARRTQPIAVSSVTFNGRSPTRQ